MKPWFVLAARLLIVAERGRRGRRYDDLLTIRVTLR
jgi:hypothetical protein